MVLELSAESSWLVRAAAAVVLAAHIGAAGIGLLSGGVALAAPKGRRIHGRAGNVFFVSMLIMSSIGACVAPFLPQPQWSSTGVAILTFYLVATSWATIRRRDGKTGTLEIGACVVAAGVAVGLLLLGLLAVIRPTSSSADAPTQANFVFAAIATFAGALDIRMILGVGLSGAQRITRHVWRMCVALLIAAFSFFLGQQQVFPASVRGSSLLFVPEIAVVGSLIFWLVRIRSRRWLMQHAADRAVHAHRAIDALRGRGKHT